MGKRALIPIDLTRGPFTSEEAARAGLTRRQLQGRSWTRLGPGVYAWNGLGDGPGLVIEAIMRRLPPTAVLSGRTAAWLHGLDLPPCDPIEVTLPRDSGFSGRVGVLARRATVAPEDIDLIRGHRVTTVPRTLADLSTRLTQVETVVATDSALHKRLVNMDELLEWTMGRARMRGIKRWRNVLGLAEPRAESPMESRLRMLLVTAGLPRPLAQVDLANGTGEFVARVDLYYPGSRLAIEYDGATHRESLIEDNRRQNRLLGAGYRLLRFASGDVLRAPESVVIEVRGALALAA